MLPLVVHTSLPSHVFTRSAQYRRKIERLDLRTRHAPGSVRSKWRFDKKLLLIKKNIYIKIGHFEPHISSRCNFFIHSLFWSMKTKNTSVIFYIQLAISQRKMYKTIRNVYNKWKI